MQTVYQREIFNSRSKNFYDIYILYHLKKEEIDFEHLKEACQNTFKHRYTDFNIDSILNVLAGLKVEKDLKIRWSSYQKRFCYAEEISFDEAVNIVIEVVKNIR
ncbi:nucleotidyl transferase AbiEii/AbiGii toxin family protein [Eggerthia catenaformis]|uniref:nucleotidyl transferase AbiEii/AbiGii toxin family protein n=1 Tax=Eggerthia catenaformis TaxID=31973 RepID=UPI003CD0D8CE